MKPYIYGKRSGIHIIDIRETLRGLLRARKFIAQAVANGEDVLFVGTKRQARDVIQEEARRCNMHFVSERWLGGTLTNFRTIRSRLQRLEELEALVASPQWEAGYSKKMKAALARELKKIRRNLDGIRKMNRLPGVVVVVDLRKEHNAVREARLLGIPTVALLDTDSSPDQASIPIPGNDDSMRSIALVMRLMADAVAEGLRSRPERPERSESADGPDYGAPPARRRQPRRVGAGRVSVGGPTAPRNGSATAELPVAPPAASDEARPVPEGAPLSGEGERP
jgi:small subunit ribosomal protein S2